MCICINCRHIHRCQTYLIIKKKHQKNNQNIIEEKYIFNPMNNIISININIQSRNIILD
uniref:Ycf34 n=1 Tax=Dasyclonium flaccidum TaxID=2007274 RepID=A0A1Z1MKY2_9FLOR|nr:hypothetical protein [Dasyclonium flaccidum]ARW66596.1 hypothetical protein [Dasyclonium flaccidum]